MTTIDEPAAGEARVLIISREFDPHADQMVVLLKQWGVPCFRWVTEAFPRDSTLSFTTDGTAVTGSLRTEGWEIDLASIRSVWYRRRASPVLPPGLSDDESRFAETETRAAFDGLCRTAGWFWVNHPDRNRVAGSKMLQLKAAGELGFRIPRTLVTNDPGKVREFHRLCGGAVIYKPFNSGFFADSQKVCYTTPLQGPDLERLDLIRLTPGLFQENVPKRFELRVTIIGRRVFATEIHSQGRDLSRDDWRAADVEDLRHVPHRLPGELERRCVAFLERFGLAYGAMDFIVTPDGDYVFLENNVGGQFGWLEDRTGEPMTATLARMLVAGKVL